MWGTVGIGYNTKKIKEALGVDKIDSWDVFFDPDKLAKLADCGVYMLDSPQRHHAGRAELSRARSEQPRRRTIWPRRRSCC